MAQTFHSSSILLQIGAGGGSDDHSAEVAHSGDQGSSNPLLQLDPGVAIWTWVVFILLLFLLRKFAWGPILSSVETREKNIRDSLEQAKQAQNESRRLANEHKEIIAQARSEANKIVQAAKETGEELKKKLEQTAVEEKQRILDSANKEIASAKAQAMVQLKQEAAGLVIQVSESLIRRSMDDRKHEELVEKLIEELDEESKTKR